MLRPPHTTTGTWRRVSCAGLKGLGLHPQFFMLYEVACFAVQVNDIFLTFLKFNGLHR